jgi:hypothetical protein
VFAVLWAVYRQYPYAWIGQDILVSATFCSITRLSMQQPYQLISGSVLQGIALIVTVIQIVRVPNLKVMYMFLTLEG